MAAYRLRHVGAALAALALLSPPAEAGRSHAFVQNGTASWYGEKHHGKPTASGETFDMDAMSAAHATLPFASLVLVTNLENGRAVEVRINDRSARRPGHVIDLSAAAARALEVGDAGTIRVRLEIVRL